MRKKPTPKGLKTREGVEELMKSSTSAARWEENCRAVRRANNGEFPVFWFRTVMSSGLSRRMHARF